MKILRQLLALFFIGASYLVACGDGYTDIDGTCYYTSDLDALVAFATNSGMGSEYTDVINNMGDQIWGDDGRLINWICNDCGFSGSIPSEISNLTELYNLKLTHNQLTGNIPPDVCSLTNLTSLSLSNNQLTGEIPPCIGLLTNLTYLNFQTQSLTGEIPIEICDLTNLKSLYLRYNELMHVLPPCIGTLTQLEKLMLSVNQLTGEIPSEIGNLQELDYLELYSNQFTGEIPSEIGYLQDLDYLYLYDNQLTGEIPPELGSLPSLNHLYLYDNLLTGEIPPELGSLTGLTRLYLDDNLLTGSIPPEIGGLSNLSHLNLDTNELVGEIPPEIWDLTSLFNLQLHDNQLTGSIPPEIGNLTALNHLILSDNQLTGFVPPEIGGLTELRQILIEVNFLAGSIPSEIGNLSNLWFLNLGSNQFTGEIPSELGNLDDLSNLYLDNNQLTGLIPNSFCDLENNNAITIQLSGNMLCPPYPDCLSFYTTGYQDPINCLECSGSEIGLNENCYNQNDLDVLAIFATNSGMGSEYADVINMGSQTWDGDGRLTSWGCESCGLSGSIPSETGSLTELISLDLDQNKLGCYDYDFVEDYCILHCDDTEECSGEIPLEIGNLTNLQYLHLYTNKLTGEIPLELGGLSNLLELVLYDNKLDGEIPPELGNLSNLLHLDLYENDLSGSIPPELGTLTELIDLNLESNELDGSIPPELGNLSSLKWLLLNNNDLTGAIPPALGYITEYELYLNDNQLTGLIPNSFCNLPYDIELRLSGNNFCPAYPTCLTGEQIGVQDTYGCIDCAEGEVAANGTDCYSQNDLDVLAVFATNSGMGGEYADVIERGDQGWGENGRLISWYCRYCEFSGSIPPEIGNLTELTSLEFHNHGFDSPIPPELGNLTNLTKLTLAYNELTGEIPPELGNLSNLTKLTLFYNELDGEIPPELGNLSNLLHLDLAENQLSGSIPPEIGNLTNLQDLDLDKNQLSGSIPPDIGSLTELTYLDLDENKLGCYDYDFVEDYCILHCDDTEECSGEIPLEIGNLTNLQDLYLDENQLSGSIPPELGNLSNLLYLDLDKNQLSGSIPPEIGNLTQLIYLYLDENQLSGSIPPEIGNLTQLQALNLDENQLSGSIPPELWNLSNLLRLDLDKNQLSGSIPPEIGNLTQLIYLYLDANQLSGSIPPEIGNLTQLYKIDLDQNQLSGSIPPEIGSLTELTHLYLNNNNFFGIIPDTFCNLNIVWDDPYGFNIINNQFCPPYPDCMTDEIVGEQNNHCPNCLESEEAVYDLDYEGCYSRGDLKFLSDLMANGLEVNNNPPLSLKDEPWKLGHQWWAGGRLQTFCCHDSATIVAEGLYELEALGLGSCSSECPYSFLNMYLPSSIGQLTELDTLSLIGIDLGGAIPDSITKLVDLKLLFLAFNNMNGSIPSDIGNLQKLDYLSIVKNGLSDNLPSSLWELDSLMLLDLNNNSFTGELPDTADYSMFKNLWYLDLSYNYFTGIIPETVCDMNFISTESSEFSFENNNFCPPYPGCIDSLVVQAVTLVPYYLDLDGDGDGNSDEPCDNDYCAEYSPTTGDCYGGVDNSADVDDNCFSNNFDECSICEGDGYEALCGEGFCENMDCLGVCGGDAVVDVNKNCCEENELDDCLVCSGGNSGHPANSDKDQYCGSCFGDNECIPQLKFYEPGDEVVDIRTDNIRFHFSTPVNYLNGGIKIISYNNSVIDFSINSSVADTVLELTFSEPLISNNQMSILIDPCKITNIDTLNKLEIVYCLDTNADFIPAGGLGQFEVELEITMDVALMGDYDLNNQVDAIDLNYLLGAWKTNDYRYELGPFKGDAPYLQPLDFDFNQDYNIEDLMAFVQMWNWDYNYSLLREMTLESTIDYVPEYHFDKNRFSINLSMFPGEIKRIWFRVNYQNNNIEIENTASGSEFDINLYGHKEDVRIYDWIMGAIAPINNRQITLLDIVSPSKDDQVFDFQYEIVGFNNETASGDMKITYHPVPEGFSIGQAYPNPFNPVTIIDYGISETTNLSIGVYDIRGRQVNLIVKNAVDPGFYNFFWDASAYSSGIYLIKFQISDMVKIQRVLLLK